MGLVLKKHKRCSSQALENAGATPNAGLTAYLLAVSGTSEALANRAVCGVKLHKFRRFGAFVARLALAELVLNRKIN